MNNDKELLHSGVTLDKRKNLEDNRTNREKSYTAPCLLLFIF